MKCNEICTRNFLHLMKISTTICAILATFFVVKLSKRHINNYTNPLFQKKIIVIIYIIPFYALNSMTSSLFVKREYLAEVCAILRGLYEAILVVSFFQLIVAFLCWKDEVSWYFTI